MDFDIDIPKLPSLVQRYGAAHVGAIVRDEQKRSGDRAGAIVVRRAQARVRVKTGHLRRSVTFATTIAGFTSETKVGTAVPYGKWLDEGTGIYGPKGAPIRPKRAKFLRFQVGGKTVYARSVRGVPGDKWFTGAVQEARRQVLAEFKQLPARIVNRVVKGG